jgi:hypothetical protein
MDESMKDDPNHPGKHIDPQTGIWPICEWGPECRRGFVSSERFARRGDKVIKRTNRNLSRQWRKLDEGTKTL